MKKTLIIICLFIVLIMQVFAVSALTASDARENWKDAKILTKEAQETHKKVKIDFLANKSDENKEAFVKTGKDFLNAALNEAETWLIWKNLEARNNPEVSDEIKELIEVDVNANLKKIEGLKTEVGDVKNPLELGVVFLKMVGKYFELISDVARNSGGMLVHIANEKLDTINKFEEKLRTAAEGIENNNKIIEKLDNTKKELESAKTNINQAKIAYEQVKIPGTPLIKFNEGNNNLRASRMNLIVAHSNLNQAYMLIVNS